MRFLLFYQYPIFKSFCSLFFFCFFFCFCLFVLFVFLFVCLFVCLFSVQGHLLVQSRPEILFGNTSVVEGSVIWLYCEVNSIATTLTAFWNKDTRVLIEDVPHIRMRNSTSDSSTTFFLVIDNFQMSDSGRYQCVIQNGQDEGNGRVFNLNG